ncbi:MFS transporter [Lysinibacillus sp. NPDC097162]|uniref:MFS transporter n=1 Tax=Lysinibacillus sp. NPDC097162 TaxID=3364140 RepID=UPI003806ECA9
MIYLIGMYINMTLRKNKNFLYLISGRVITNFGDSLYTVVLAYITISIYNLGADGLALFGLIAFFPSLINFAFGTLIDNCRNKKNLLITFEIVQLLSITGILFTVYFRLDILLIFICHFIFSFANTLIYPVQSSLIPEILRYKKTDIEKSVYVMNITNNTVDIISNFLSSIILIYISVISILILDMFTFFLCIALFLKIHVKNNVYNNNQIQDKPNFKNNILFAFKYFWREKTPSRIVVMEGILSGLTTMVMRIVGAYLVILNIGVEYLGVLLAIQRGSELVGVFLSNHIKMPFKNFFIIDYLISGAAITLIAFTDSIAIKTVLFALTFLLIGMSGTVYGKMIYYFYDFQHIGKVTSVINTVSSFAIVTCLLIPMIYNDVVNLIIITGIITITFGLYLLFFNNSNDSVEKIS